MLPSHVNVLPDESHELPGYACLLGNLLEAAGVAMSEPNCCFVMVWRAFIALILFCSLLSDSPYS